jgi:hypothetical protein
MAAQINRDAALVARRRTERISVVKVVVVWWCGGAVGNQQSA